MGVMPVLYYEKGGNTALHILRIPAQGKLAITTISTITNKCVLSPLIQWH
jgi:hypothetical protein